MPLSEIPFWDFFLKLLSEVCRLSKTHCLYIKLISYFRPTCNFLMVSDANCPDYRKVSAFFTKKSTIMIRFSTLSGIARSTPSALLPSLSQISLNFVDLVSYNFNGYRGRKVDFGLLFCSVRTFHLLMCRPSHATFQWVQASHGRLLPFVTTCGQLAALQQTFHSQKSKQKAT